VQRIGKYNIQRLVARGGMGELYLAHDPDLDREVAIKVMSEEIMRDEQARARFYREARAAARLQHRNIVTVFDFAHDGEIPYFVMEFLRGQTLSQRLRQGPPLTLAMKLHLVVELCEGLHFAHGEGVIHRDIKPANIWLLEDGGVKLLDFGIAKSSSGTITLGTSVVGSAGYMSPEQIEGQPVDGRSDVFSVGAVLFEMIAGRPPFVGDSVTAVMMKIVLDEPAPDIRTIAPDTPAMLAAAVRRALEKSPDDRYADAADMAADLRAVRLEIADQDQEEPHAEITTIPDVVPDVAWKRAHVVRDDEAPKPTPTLISQPKGSAQEVVPAGDYDLRPPDETSKPVSIARDPDASQSPKRRSVFLVYGGVAAMVLIALSIFMWPRLFGPNRPPHFRFTSTPDGANIVVNGVDTSLRTPADVQIAQLPATIRIELAGYQPFVTQVTEEAATQSDLTIRASLAKIASPAPPRVDVPPRPLPEQAVPAPARPLGELKVLRAPGDLAFCNASIGSSWNGSPFDGVTSIRLPAQRYSIRIECSNQPPRMGTIEVPPGTTERNFSEVVTLNPLSDAPGQP
jgi:serine/threonine protein kinase